MQTIDLNLIPGGVAPVVNVSQYDEGRQYAVRVLDGHSEADLTGLSVSIEGKKKDGKVVEYDSSFLVNGTPAVRVDGSTVTVTTPLQMTAAAGKALMKLKLTDIEGNLVHTMKFYLDCDLDPEADGDISDSELPAIVDGARVSAARAEEAAETAESVSLHPAYIGENGNWFIFNMTSGEYVDSGTHAQGPRGADGTGSVVVRDHGIVLA